MPAFACIQNKIFLAIGLRNSEIYEICSQPGQEHIADYSTNHHSATIHQHVRSHYIHIQMDSSPTDLNRAYKPSTQRGCAEILRDPYYKKVPLPSIPNCRDLSKTHKPPVSVQHSKGYSNNKRTKARLTKQLNTQVKTITVLCAPAQ